MLIGTVKAKFLFQHTGSGAIGPLHLQNEHRIHLPSYKDIVQVHIFHKCSLAQIYPVMGLSTWTVLATHLLQI